MRTDVNRREAKRQYKERKPRRGAFAVRCRETGQVWVGASMDLDAARNGLWFTLRHGTHLDRLLQCAWNEHGEPAFEYEVLEELEDDVFPLAVRNLLKEKRARWVARSGARTLL